MYASLGEALAADAHSKAPIVEEKQVVEPIVEEKQVVEVSTEEKQFYQYPIHPIPQLQGAFEESILEASDKSASKRNIEIDAQTRRRDLLENDEYERICGRKWRQEGREK